MNGAKKKHFVLKTGEIVLVNETEAVLVTIMLKWY